jgi:putative thioredoxin
VSTETQDSPTIYDVDQADFEQRVLERSRELPVVVDFWADWCGPCKQLTPVLERAAGERGILLVKVDTDANPEVARRYDIRGIPAVKAFRRGHIVREFVGALPPAAVEHFLDELTAPSPLERLRAQGWDGAVVTALEADDWERAFELLLGELEQAEPERRDEIRRVMVSLFEELGQEHPLATRYRRRLATALY